MNALKRLPKQAQQQVTLGKAPSEDDVFRWQEEMRMMWEITHYH